MVAVCVCLGKIGDRLEVDVMLSYEEAVRFHGHNGPFLAIGYRMGQFANESLSPQGISDISCVVKSPLRTPFTCVVDGIQRGVNP